MQYLPSLTTPLKTLRVAAVCTSLLFLQACSDDQKESASKAWEDTKEATSEAVDVTKEASGNAWDKTKEVSSDAWDKTKEMAAEPVVEDEERVQIEDR